MSYFSVKGGVQCHIIFPQAQGAGKHPVVAFRMPHPCTFNEEEKVWDPVDGGDNFQYYTLIDSDNVYVFDATRSLALKSVALVVIDKADVKVQP